MQKAYKYTEEDMIDCFPEEVRDMVKKHITRNNTDPISDAEKMLGKNHGEFTSEDALVALRLAMIQK